VKDQLAPELVEHLTYLLINSLEGGRLGVGGQLSIRSELGVCDVAVGMGVGQKPMTPWTQHPSFCLAKPLLGLSVGLLIDDGFDPQAQVGTVALHSAGDAINLSCSTFDVLSHQAGLTGPSALQWRILEEDVLPSVLSSVTATDAPRYSDVVGGLVVEAVIRRQTGSDPADWVTRHLLEPMGLDDISVEPGAVGRVIKSGTASVPFGALPADPTPIISELLEVHWARSRLAFGGWTASRSMADLYWNLLEVVRGTAVEGAPSVDVLASLLEPETPFRDEAQGHTVCFSAGGFLLGLEEAGVSATAGPRSFGHAGGYASAFAFADPDSGVAVAAYLNGISVDFAALASARSSLSDACLSVIAAA
jgi:CubicO group peptidase (beta-lactamase class C family)